MKFRLQYSLLTMLVLTAVCAVVVAYVVVPWRHEKHQTEIIERLKAHEEFRYEFSENYEKKGTYRLEHEDSDPTTLQLFLDTAAGSDRIDSVGLEYECFTEEQLAKFHQLYKLERLEFKRNVINEARMRILRDLPLKEVEFYMPESASFETWPLQPQLEVFRMRFGVDFASPPLQLKSHPRLRELHIDSCPHDVAIESCPELQNLSLLPPYDDLPTKLKLKNLPKLESLALSFENLHPDSTIDEFPQLKKLSIRSEIFPLIEKHQLQNLTSFRENSFHVTLTPAQVDKILRLPELEELSLQSNWNDFRKGVPIPLMPQLHDLELRVPYTGQGKILVPEEVAIAFIRQSPSLQALKLPLQDVSAELLAEIATLEHLCYVKLEVRGKIRGDLSVLRQCQKLYNLELDFKELTPEHIAQFNELHQIERLTLHHRGEESIVMTTLKPRPKLSVLYNHDYYTQSFPVMLPDSKAPMRIFRCNGGMINVAPAATQTASP
jgi:hypothetical protein